MQTVQVTTQSALPEEIPDIVQIRFVPSELPVPFKKEPLAE
jgi:hypothetical protein